MARVSVGERLYERRHWLRRVRRALLGNVVARRERRWERRAVRRLRRAGVGEAAIARARQAWRADGVSYRWLARAPLGDLLAWVAEA